MKTHDSCECCNGSGERPISGALCAACDGDGVVEKIGTGHIREGGYQPTRDPSSSPPSTAIAPAKGEHTDG